MNKKEREHHGTKQRKKENSHENLVKIAKHIKTYQTIIGPGIANFSENKRPAPVDEQSDHGHIDRSKRKHADS